MQKYNSKKVKIQALLGYIVSHVSPSMVDRISICGVVLSMVADVTLEKKKLHSGNFCGHRFCPLCSWRKAKKDALKISLLMRHIQEDMQKDFIFLTLTAPNVKGWELSDEITRFNDAFKKLTKRKEVLPVIKGYIRKIEITYNKDRDDYHTHFHVLIAVNKSYFTDKTYIKQEKWLSIWQDVMGDNSITQVDVRRVQNQDGKAINEIAKYAAKDADFLVSQSVFDDFYNALKGRQAITYNGFFAEANKLFKAKKLDHLREVDTTEYVYLLLYKWGLGEYVEAECRELTPEELKRINRQLIDETDVEE